MFYILSYKFKYPIQRSVLYLFALNLGFLGTAKLLHVIH